jgi:hypothetical protein
MSLYSRNKKHNEDVVSKIRILRLLLIFLIPVAVVLPQTQASVFSDNFDDGDISDWTVTTTGMGTFDVSSDKYVSSPFSVHMKSLTSGDKAMGVSPSYELNLSENYDVSFSFLIPHTNNHWFEVFNNNQIYLLIDSGDDFKYYDGSSSHLIDELVTNQWYLIEIKARPSLGTYIVYIDSEPNHTCDMWTHTGFETKFRIGDRNSDDTYYDYGEAYWDNFVITQPVDSDGDGIMDPNDNCPYVYNPGQADRNLDGWGDVCECQAANLNQTGVINFSDFSIAASDWWKTGTTLAGDINGDEFVDLFDLEIFAYYWLSNCSEE